MLTLRQPAFCVRSRTGSPGRYSGRPEAFIPEKCRNVRLRAGTACAKGRSVAIFMIVQDALHGASLAPPPFPHTSLPSPYTPPSPPTTSLTLHHSLSADTPSPFHHPRHAPPPPGHHPSQLMCPLLRVRFGLPPHGGCAGLCSAHGQPSRPSGLWYVIDEGQQSERSRHDVLVPLRHAPSERR